MITANSCLKPAVKSSAAVAALVLLCSCGGGGGGGGGAASVRLNCTLSQTSVALQANTGDSQYRSVTINFTINNWDKRPTQAGAVSQAVWQGTAISGVATTFGPITPLPTNPNTATGTITIDFWIAEVLGAGTYSGNVIFSLCFDQSSASCSNMAAGPATSIAVVLTVSGAATPVTSASLSPATLSLEGASADVVGPTRDLSLVLSHISPGPFVTFSQPAGGFVSEVHYSAIGLDNGNITIQYVKPGSLALGVHTESVILNICIDATCAHPLSNSPIVVPLTYTITGAAGSDFVTHTVGLVASDIAWSPAAQRIYAAVSSFSPQNPGSLTELDPATNLVTRSLPLSGETSALSVSDDGAFAYVAFSDRNVVERINLATMTLDISIPLGSDPAKGPFYAGYVAVQPGQARTLAVSKFATALGLGDFASQQTFLYDDAAPRPNAFGATGQGQLVNALSWNGDGSVLYAYDRQSLFAVAVGASGFTQTGVSPGVALGAVIQFDGGLVYGGNTAVVDATSGMQVGSFLQSSNISQPSLALDGALNRAYIFYDEYLTPAPLWTLETFNLQQRTSIAKARISGFSLGVSSLTVTNGRLVRWGSSGLAINGNEGILIISGPIVTL